MNFYSDIPRPEHPNPQFFRKNWVNLNGKWDFEMPEFRLDYADSASLQISAAEYVYEYALNEADIDFSKITVCTDNSENSSISINKVIIYTDCEKSRVLAALAEVAENTEVEIIND